MAMALIVNDGLPQAAWNVIGDQTIRKLTSRVSLTYTLILFQVIVALLICGFGMTNARASVVDTPDDLRIASLVYVRITYMSILSSIIEASVSNCARALDHPEIPLLISAIKTTLNIILDAGIMSQANTGFHRPSMNNRAGIRLASELTSATIGTLFLYRYTLQKELKKAEEDGEERSKARPCSASLIILWQHGCWTFAESAIRNVFNAWLMIGFEGGMGLDDKLAWGTFSAIRGRGSILMVPLQALEASTLTYVGHAWGEWRAKDPENEKPEVKEEELKGGFPQADLLTYADCSKILRNPRGYPVCWPRWSRRSSTSPFPSGGQDSSPGICQNPCQSQQWYNGCGE